MWNEKIKGRGRPKKISYSQYDIKLLEYLALISIKYDVDSEKFFNKIVKAWNHQKSICYNLIIECRKNFEGHAIFVITKSEKVVTQFRMPEYLLKEKNPIKTFESSIRLAKNTIMEKDQPPIHIKDLKAGMKRVHIRADILKLHDTREVLTRFGSYARLTNAIVGDTTGNIKLALWNKQIDKVSIGDRISIDNANVVRFRGELQLRIGRQGELRVVEVEENPSLKKISRV